MGGNWVWLLITLFGIYVGMRTFVFKLVVMNFDHLFTKKSEVADISEVHFYLGVTLLESDNIDPEFPVFLAIQLHHDLFDTLVVLSLN